MSAPASHFTISRASPRDARRIGEIFTRAFDKDTHSQMKIMGMKPGAFGDGMLMGAKYWIETKGAVLIKATDDRDGKIVGACAWGFKNVDLDPAAAPDDGAEADEDKNEEGKGEKGEEEAGEEPVPGADKVKKLNEMTSKHLDDFMERVMPEGSKSIFIGSIAVDPQYDGQGVGSQLLKWGTTEADRTGAFSWVHSSEAGWPLFEKHGFKEVDRLTFDLDEWAVGPPPKDGVFGDREKWGEYTFRYGLRQAAKA